MKSLVYGLSNGFAAKLCIKVVFHSLSLMYRLERGFCLGAAHTNVCLLSGT